MIKILFQIFLSFVVLSTGISASAGRAGLIAARISIYEQYLDEIKKWDPSTDHRLFNRFRGYSEEAFLILKDTIDAYVRARPNSAASVAEQQRMQLLANTIATAFINWLNTYKDWTEEDFGNSVSVEVKFSSDRPAIYVEPLLTTPTASTETKKDEISGHPVLFRLKTSPHVVVRFSDEYLAIIDTRSEKGTEEIVAPIRVPIDTPVTINEEKNFLIIEIPSTKQKYIFRKPNMKFQSLGSVVNDCNAGLRTQEE